MNHQKIRFINSYFDEIKQYKYCNEIGYNSDVSEIPSDNRQPGPRDPRVRVRFAV